MNCGRARRWPDALCDFTFHMGVTRFDQTSASQLREIVRGGTASFKVFLAYKGAFGVDDRELYETLKLAKELGVIVTAHCENAELVSALQAKLLARARRDPSGMNRRGRASRSRGRASSDDVRRCAGDALLHCAYELQGCRLCRARSPRARGVNVWVETLIQYLTLDKTWPSGRTSKGRST